SEDIAFVVKPSADRLEEINSEVSNWILVDSQNVVLPDPSKAVQKLPASAPVKVQPGDTLLAVIHGYGKDGWRDAAAQQTFLLKNAVGRDLKVESRQDASNDFKVVVAHMRGDIISEDYNHTHGFLYWTGAKYAWFAATKRATK
ncbi:MAG: hypothetical protein QOF61_1638, partial [Acidobacteriota bacterium]|nr:hypothetical protein [Acidobacteriota bacterium]